MKPTPLKRKTPLMRQTPLRTTTPMRKKRAGKRRKSAVENSNWLAAVSTINFCVRCGAMDRPLENAHRDEGKGMSQKTDDMAVARLCNVDHFELGNGSKYAREFRRSEMDRCIVLTVIEVGRRFKVTAS
jgi:hypothetical protein